MKNVQKMIKICERINRIKKKRDKNQEEQQSNGKYLTEIRVVE